MAVAFADSYEIIPDPSSTEEITGFFGEPATPPAVAGSIQGQQVFEVFDTTTDKTVGTFDADESTNPSLYGAANELLLVTKDLSGTAGTATGVTENITSVTGFSPADIAVEGNQLFDVYNAASDQATGAFDGEVTNTSDVLLNYTEEILVTNDVSGTVGSAAGDTPPVGSLYNVFYILGDPSFYNLYSVTPSSSGDVVSDTLVSRYGDVAIPISFYDATGAMTVNSFTVPSDNESIVPVGSEQISGVNGVPPLDSSVQGYQEFDVDNMSGNAIGTFDADVTTANGFFGNSSEALLVTADSAPQAPPQAIFRRSARYSTWTATEAATKPSIPTSSRRPART